MSYPSYRFHPTGVMALVRSREDDALLTGWSETPPDGFRCPQGPHYAYGCDVPEDLRSCPVEDEKKEDVDPTDEDPREDATEELTDEEYEALAIEGEPQAEEVEAPRKGRSRKGGRRL